MNEREELLKDIEKLTNYIWNSHKHKGKVEKDWIRNHIGKDCLDCNIEELKILRYLLAFKAKNGECPIKEHQKYSPHKIKKSILINIALAKKYYYEYQENKKYGLTD